MDRLVSVVGCAKYPMTVTLVTEDRADIRVRAAIRKIPDLATTREQIVTSLIKRYLTRAGVDFDTCDCAIQTSYFHDGIDIYIEAPLGMRLVDLVDDVDKSSVVMVADDTDSDDGFKSDRLVICVGNGRVVTIDLVAMDRSDVTASIKIEPALAQLPEDLMGVMTTMISMMFHSVPVTFRTNTTDPNCVGIYIYIEAPLGTKLADLVGDEYKGMVI